MPRPQFSLKTMLWLMVVVGAFLGGIDLGHKWAWKDAIRTAYLADVESLRRLMKDPPQSGLRLVYFPEGVPPISAGVFVGLLLAVFGTGVGIAIRSRRGQKLKPAQEGAPE